MQLDNNNLGPDKIGNRLKIGRNILNNVMISIYTICIIGTSIVEPTITSIIFYYVFDAKLTLHDQSLY